jgi:small subunit ribosomal protein S6
MTRQYEIVYIFDSALDEPEINRRLEKLHTVLRSAETPEPVTALAHWGKRTLAYPIKRREVGYYVVAQVEARTDALTELERLIKLEEGILRHLIVINEGLSPVAVAAPVEAPVVVPDEEEEDDE